MKPRITREFSETYRAQAWFCRGDGFLGLGDTPSIAYWDWLWRVQNRRQP